MRTGEIYHLDEVPALHRGRPKGRYVVVVTPEDEMFLDKPIYVVACTTSLLPDQMTADDVVPLPWHRDGRAATGFRRRTWALPKWLLKVRPSDLSQQRTGYLYNRALQAIIDRLPQDPVADLTEL